MKNKKTNSGNFKLHNNCGELKKTVLNKPINLKVPVPRISREVLGKFFNVEQGQVRALWSDQGSNVGTKGLNHSVGYACRLTWDDISLGLVGHFEFWTKKSAREVLPALEKWVENLIKDKGVDPRYLKKGTTWLINGPKTRQDPNNNPYLIDKLEKAFSNWNPSWNPPSTHARFICDQGAPGFSLKIDSESDVNSLSFVWPTDESIIKVDSSPEGSFSLNQLEESIPLLRNSKTWGLKRLKNLIRSWLTGYRE